MSELEFFKKCIIGNFNNLSQIERQLQLGKITHPISTHSSNMCNNMIKNLPKNFNKTFILEKNSYTSYGINIINTKLYYLYLLEQTKEKKIKVSYYDIENSMIEKNLSKKDNNLSLDFKKLKLSQKLNPIIFEYKTNNMFYGKSVSNIGDDFSLIIEKNIYKNKIETTQIIKKGDKVITGSNFPIIYTKEKHLP